MRPPSKRLICFLHFFPRETSQSSRTQAYEKPSWTWLWKPLLLNLRTLSVKIISGGSRSIWLLWWRASVLTAWSRSPGTSAVHPTKRCKRWDFWSSQLDILGLHDGTAWLQKSHTLSIGFSPFFLPSDWLVWSKVWQSCQRTIHRDWDQASSLSRRHSQVCGKTLFRQTFFRKVDHHYCDDGCIYVISSFPVFLKQIARLQFPSW